MRKEFTIFDRMIIFFESKFEFRPRIRIFVASKLSKVFETFLGPTIIVIHIQLA